MGEDVLFGLVVIGRHDLKIGVFGVGGDRGQIRTVIFLIIIVIGVGLFIVIVEDAIFPLLFSVTVGTGSFIGLLEDFY